MDRETNGWLAANQGNFVLLLERSGPLNLKKMVAVSIGFKGVWMAKEGRVWATSCTVKGRGPKGPGGEGAAEVDLREEVRHLRVRAPGRPGGQGPAHSLGTDPAG